MIGGTDMEKYIPYEKMSKKMRREYDAKKRGGWGEINPVTRRSENPAAYNRTAEKIAEKFSCPLIDIRSPFLLSHNYTNLLSPDGIHPNVEGHEMIDRLLCEAVA